jgi:hypothetical protein
MGPFEEALNNVLPGWRVSLDGLFGYLVLLKEVPFDGKSDGANVPDKILWRLFSGSARLGHP